MGSEEIDGFMVKVFKAIQPSNTITNIQQNQTAKPSNNIQQPSNGKAIEPPQTAKPYIQL